MGLVQLYSEWLKHDLERNGQCTIFAKDLLPALRILDVITMDEYLLVENKILPDEKNVKLFMEFLPSKGEPGLHKLAKLLQQTKNHNFDELIEISKRLNFNINLNQDSKVYEKADFTVPSTVKLRHFFNNKSVIFYLAQQYLEKYLQINCEYIAQFWKDILPKYDMSEGFVCLELLTNTGNKTGIPICNYNDLFQSITNKKSSKRIIIEASPGCGKSTYVNKMALDWANGDKYLRTIFDFVLFFELKHLTTIEEGFQSFFPPDFHGFAKQQLNKDRNKVLIIFDGFDEMDQSGESFFYIQSILRFKRYPFVTCILTTRQSHIDRIPQIALDQRIIITGFDSSSVDDFMIKQQCTVLTSDERDSLGSLMQIPLFCAIYCSIKRFSPKIKLASSYDLIQALVFSSTQLHLNKNQKINDVAHQDILAQEIERDSLAIGKLALSKLDIISLNVAMQIDKRLLHLDCTMDLEMVRLALLIKKKCPTGRYLEFNDEYSFPHQMIAEYYAAEYVANTVNLESINPNCFGTATNQPFVQFILRIILTKWSLKLCTDEIIATFLDVPNIFWTWANSIPEIAHSPLISVRIKFCANEDKVTIVYDFSKPIFEVSVKDSGITKWKPDWWNTIEKITKSKVNEILIFTYLRVSPFFSATLSLADYLRMYSIWNISQLDKNVDCEKIIDVSITRIVINFVDEDNFCKSIMKCANLQTLNLQNCSLSAEFFSNLADGIRSSHLVRLENINLSHNKNLWNVSHIMAALSRCQHLKTFKMKVSHPFCASGATTDSLGRLENLDLSGSAVVGENANFFISLTKCPKLKRLNIERCSLTKESCLKLMDGLLSEKFSKLERINLSYNSKIKEVPHFFDALLECKKLESIKVRACLINASLDSFTKMFSKQGFTDLKTLDVSDNPIGSNLTFFSLLTKCINLVKLNLAEIYLTLQSLKYLIDSFKAGDFQMLEYLNLSQNAIGDCGEIFIAIGHCINLKILDISFCNWSPSSIKTLANVFNENKIKKLENLNLAFNMHVGNGHGLFKALVDYGCLTFLNLTRCKLIEASRKYLPMLEQRGCNIVGKEEEIQNNNVREKKKKSLIPIVKEPTFDKKVVVVGDGGCGKTALLLTIMGRSLEENMDLLTIPYSADPYSVNIVFNKAPVTLCLCDTYGQEDYDRLRQLIYPQTDIFLICYKISSRDSFGNVEHKWHPEVTHHCPNTPYILVGVVGCYKESHSEYISTKVGIELANKIGASGYFECSPWLNEGIQELLQAVASLTMQKVERKKKKMKELLTNTVHHYYPEDL